MRILVAGSTGHLGRHVVTQLKSQGHFVRGLARQSTPVARLRVGLDEVFAADATDRQALVGCCDGIDAVVSTIGLVGKGGSLTSWEVDYGANRNLLEEAGRAAVSKFVYTSVVRAPALEKLQLVRAKRAFERDLRASGMAYSILYPNGFFSDFDEYLDMARKGRVYVFGNGQFRINPVHGADVATAIAEAITADDEEIEVGGPEVLTHECIAQEAFRALGTTPQISRIPAGFVRVGLLLMRWLTPLRVHGVVEFPLTVLSNDVITATTGQRQLADYFREAAASQAPGTEIVPHRPGK
jgi:uncharacterized protein YbjT (DUF2867 family)